MKVWCDRCGFKFEQNLKGRKASICPGCRKLREDKWRKSQEAKTEKPKKEPKIEAI